MLTLITTRKPNLSKLNDALFSVFYNIQIYNRKYKIGEK